MNNPPRWHTPLIVLILIGATAAIYWPILRHDFVNWDDLDLVIQNPYLDRTWPNLQRDLVGALHGPLHARRVHVLVDDRGLRG